MDWNGGMDYRSLETS